MHYAVLALLRIDSLRTASNAMTWILKLKEWPRTGEEKRKNKSLFIQYLFLYNSRCVVHLFTSYWKCNFPMTPHVSWLVDLSQLPKRSGLHFHAPIEALSVVLLVIDGLTIEELYICPHCPRLCLNLSFKVTGPCVTLGANCQSYGRTDKVEHNYCLPEKTKKTKHVVE